MNSDIFPPMPRPRYHHEPARTVRPMPFGWLTPLLAVTFVLALVGWLNLVPVRSDYAEALATLETHRARLEADYGPMRTVPEFLDAVTTDETRRHLAVIWARKITDAKARGDYLTYCADNVTLWRK